MSKEKTILFVMPRLPFPTSSGRKTSLYHYCRILSEELDYRLIVAAFLENGDDPTKKPAFIDSLIVLPKASALSRICRIFLKSIILRKEPMQVALYWSQEAKKTIDDIITREGPEFVIGDMVRSTEYIKEADAFRIADLDDRISLRYQRQLETDIEGVNPYGAFLKTFPKLIQKIMMNKWLKVSVVKNEIRLLNKYELEIGSECEKTIFVAAKEAREFNKDLNAEKAVAVPIGVDTEYFNYREVANCGNVIGFLGAMSVAHNENAVRYFIAEILPHVIERIPDVKFLVIGGGTSDDLLKLRSEYVEFTGYVDDVRDYLGICKTFVCPMTFGSGIKTKILEAMAMGLPVVTTSIGAENIEALDGVDWYIEDNPVKFANYILRIMDDDNLRKQMSLNARNFILKNYTWQVAKENLENILDKT